MSVTRLIIVLISAEIDSVFLITLPLVFFMYLFVEFVFLAAMDSSIWSRMVTLNGSDDRKTGVQTVVTFENLRDENLKDECFQKVVTYIPVDRKTCSGFSEPSRRPSPVVIFVGLTSIAALFLLTFFLRSAFWCLLDLIKRLKRKLRRNALLLKSKRGNFDESKHSGDATGMA